MKVLQQKKKRGYSKQAKAKKKKWWTPFRIMFHSFFGALTLTLMALFIASAYSDLVSPEKYIFFAYLGLAFPVLFVLNICFFIYWVILKKWHLIFVLAITLAVCWVPFSHYCPLNFPTKSLPTENIIKVLSYNVMSFAYTDHSKRSPNKIIEYIAQSDADIVCLQEYMVSSRPNLMSSKDVADALPMYPYIAEVFLSSPQNRYYKYGLAVLSKYPITQSRKININSVYNGGSMHEINVHGKKITIFNNHLESFKLTAEERAKYSEIFSLVNLELFEGFGGWIQQKLGQAFQIRAQQAELIAQEIKEKNGYYTIVCGDFNDTPISYTRRTILGSLLDAYAESGLGLGISYNRNFFLFRIDHIFCSPSMQAYNCKVDTRTKLSDHYPIFCYLRMN